MKDDSKTQVSSSSGDVAAEDPRTQIVPLELGSAISPFDLSAARKCYIKDPGPPMTLKEIPCSDIVIIDDTAEKFTVKP